MKIRNNSFSKMLLVILAFTLYSNYAKCIEVSSISNPFKIINNKFLYFQDGHDLIILKDGTEINCNIVEINDNEVKYKRADNPDGPLISISKEKIFKINYANGTSDFFGNQNFQNNQNVNSNNQNLDKNELRRNANNGLLWSILSLFVPYVGPILAGVGIRLGQDVLRKTDNDKLSYASERSTANAAVIVGYISCVLSILVAIFSIILVFI